MDVVLAVVPLGTGVCVEGFTWPTPSNKMAASERWSGEQDSNKFATSEQEFARY